MKIFLRVNFVSPPVAPLPHGAASESVKIPPQSEWFYHWRRVCRGVPMAAMKKPEKPYLFIDGDDAFGHFEDPDWVEKMLAAGRKYAAQPSERKTSQRKAEAKPAAT